VLLALTVVLVSGPSQSQDAIKLQRELTSATDFRVRVAAALSLGKRKDPSNAPTLEQALSDSNPAVRAAAAAALAVISSPTSMVAVERARSQEKDAGVRQQLDRTIATLKASNKTKYIVSIGRLENKSGNPKLDQTFKTVARNEIARVPNVEVALNDQEAAAKARDRKLLTVALDGKLTQLSKTGGRSDIAFAAKVEFVIRKIPEQSLKGSVRGNASALSSGGSLNDSEMKQLELDAMTAAVQSALKGAPTALEAAAK